MSRVTALESPASGAAARRQPLLTRTVTSSEASSECAGATHGVGRSRRGSRMGETAGECAAVCCCCPCAMLHLIILAVYRLPRGLWGKKKRKRLLRKKRRNSSEETANRRKSMSLGLSGGDEVDESTEDEDRGGENDVVDWDNEVWDRFYGAGFWRSASQRSDE
ncbi:hypothetical protein C2S51_011390 [Perilla frutescens var. frutescens]|nr:hypothetical protein C2S51_011390 [Perilla frutescens var. frutescens]